MSLTNFSGGVSSFGVPVMGNIGGIPFTGNYIFVSPGTGADGQDGSAGNPLATLYEAIKRARSGYNDVIVLVGDGASTGSARLSLALAQANDSTATSGTLNWNKNAVHLIGVGAPTRVGARARIAPPTGTYTAATFGANTFVNVTGTGCMFANISAFVGFSTGSTTMVGWLENGGRNAYVNCNIQGLADVASATATGARTLQVAGVGENTFTGCVIGEDTVTRTVANASVEFSGGTPRNTFSSCVFPFQTSNAGVLGILGTGAACMDRWQLFENCSFLNNIKSTSTQMTALASLTSASPGGMLLFKNCTVIGATKFGDTNALANSYVDGGAPTAATSGLALNPT